jgi:hypothetical protein
MKSILVVQIYRTQTVMHKLFKDYITRTLYVIAHIFRLISLNTVFVSQLLPANFNIVLFNNSGHPATGLQHIETSIYNL